MSERKDKLKKKKNSDERVFYKIVSNLSFVNSENGHAWGNSNSAI